MQIITCFSPTGDAIVVQPLFSHSLLTKIAILKLLQQYNKENVNVSLEATTFSVMNSLGERL